MANLSHSVNMCAPLVDYGCIISEDCYIVIVSLSEKFCCFVFYVTRTLYFTSSTQTLRHEYGHLSLRFEAETCEIIKVVPTPTIRHF